MLLILMKLKVKIIHEWTFCHDHIHTALYQTTMLYIYNITCITVQAVWKLYEEQTEF